MTNITLNHTMVNMKKSAALSKRNTLVKAFLVLLCSTALCIHSKAQDVLAGLTSNGGPEGKGTAFTINSNGTGFSLLKGFADWGIAPNGNLLQGTDGNFYGVTSDGGTFTHTGTVFSMTPAGTIKMLKQFNGPTEGTYPLGELTKGSDGSYYGLTSSGGVNGYGTAFKITGGGTFTLLKSFTFATEGATPRGHLVLAKDGNFYGVTNRGGSTGYGTIFKMTSAGVVTVLHTFVYATEGGNCYGSLTEGKDGAFYGMTYWGGTYGYGTIFKITTGGTFSVIRHFNSATDGAYSQSDLIQATDGNFYGMTYSGGVNGNGTIFKFTNANNFSVIKSFASSKDGGNPYGVLLQHTDGLLYGMTRGGAANNAGCIFKVSTTGTYTVLHSFIAATEGSTPNGGLIVGKDGYMYGLTYADGPLQGGTAFKVLPSTGAVTVLASFNGAAAGNAPLESLVKGKDSAYYGINSTGGANGHGSIFKICAGSTSVLFSFNRNVTGGTPKGSLIQAKDGNFYGTTTDGGSKSYGTIFKITPGGTFTVLRHLAGATDGGSPQGSLVQGKDSLLYGMTNSGGPKTGGTIFKISTTGTFNVLYSFTYATDGANPEGNLIQATDGNFYGLTSNNAKAFKITPGGTFTVLHSFTSYTEGSYPLGSFVQGKDGYFYATNTSGGTYGYGTIFKMSSSGTVSVLKHLNTADGKAPKGNLLIGSDNNFYGLTSTGGTYNAGTIFKITTGGTYTVLRHLDLLKDGGNAFGSLIIAPKNNLVANAQSITVAEDGQKSITLTGSGGSPLSFAVSSSPKYGALTGSGASRTYKPNANYTGADQFSFRATVGCMASPAAVVAITITAVADTPVLASIGAKTVVKGATLTFTAKATDADSGQTIKYTLLGAPAGATINATTGVFTWTPSATGTFSFKVRATDNGSPALYSEKTVSVTVTAAASLVRTAIEEPVEEVKLSLYPNPVKDRVFVNYTFAAEYVTIRILDMNGAVMNGCSFRASGKSQSEVHTGQLKPGMYFMQVINKEKTQTLKFIKN